MESDRMGYLLPALTMQKFENQRDVVLNERRQNYENRPYGLATMAIVAALFPPNHPYHWMTIGETADLKAATFEDVREFFQTYYHPSNASLVVAGDVDTADALERVQAHFDEIPPGPKPAPLDPTAELDSERRLLLEDRVELPRLYLAWHSPAMFTDGDAEMDLLSDLIANGKVSRLYQVARLRAPHRQRSDGVSEFARARRVLAARRDGGAGPHAGRAAAGDRRRAGEADRRMARRRTKWSAATRRSRRSSSTGCRRSAASAARPISSMPTACS